MIKLRHILIFAFAFALALPAWAVLEIQAAGVEDAKGKLLLDATALVKSKVLVNSYAEFSVNHRFFGKDPAPKTPKFFVVDYLENGEHKRLKADYGKFVSLGNLPAEHNPGTPEWLARFFDTRSGAQTTRYNGNPVRGLITATPGRRTGVKTRKNHGGNWSSTRFANRWFIAGSAERTFRWKTIRFPGRILSTGLRLNITNARTASGSTGFPSFVI